MKVTKSSVKKWKSLKRQISDLQKQFYKYDKRLKALPTGKYKDLGIEIIEYTASVLDGQEMVRLEPDLEIRKQVKRRKVKA